MRIGSRPELSQKAPDAALHRRALRGWINATRLRLTAAIVFLEPA